MTTPLSVFHLSRQQILQERPSCGICQRDFHESSSLHGHVITSSHEVIHGFHRRCLRSYFKSLAHEGHLLQDSFHCLYCFKQFEDLTPLFSEEQLGRLFARNAFAIQQRHDAERAQNHLDEEQMRAHMERRAAWIGRLLGVGLGLGLISSTGPLSSAFFWTAFKAQCIFLGASGLTAALHGNLEDLEERLFPYIPIETASPGDYFTLLATFDAMFILSQYLGQSIAEHYLP